MARRPTLSTTPLAFCLPAAPQSNTLPVLCFQQLPTIKFCNHLVLITIQSARGGWPPPSADLKKNFNSLPVPSSFPYILPSSVYPNPCVFTLFTKLPGCGAILLCTERSEGAHSGTQPAPRISSFAFRVSSSPFGSPITIHHSEPRWEAQCWKFKSATAPQFFPCASSPAPAKTNSPGK